VQQEETTEEKGEIIGKNRMKEGRIEKTEEGG
jgi:hypothetical protein